MCKLNVVVVVGFLVLNVGWVVICFLVVLTYVVFVAGLKYIVVLGTLVVIGFLVLKVGSVVICLIVVLKDVVFVVGL